MTVLPYSPMARFCAMLALSITAFLLRDHLLDSLAAPVLELIGLDQIPGGALCDLVGLSRVLYSQVSLG